MLQFNRMQFTLQQSNCDSVEINFSFKRILQSKGSNPRTSRTARSRFWTHRQNGRRGVKLSQKAKRSPLKSPLKSTVNEALSQRTHWRKQQECNPNKPTSRNPSSSCYHWKPVPTIFSPEIPSGFHARSPAPTTNSQRREMKRLRASLPSLFRLREHNRERCDG